MQNEAARHICSDRLTVIRDMDRIGWADGSESKQHMDGLVVECWRSASAVACTWHNNAIRRWRSAAPQHKTKRDKSARVAVTFRRFESRPSNDLLSLSLVPGLSFSLSFSRLLRFVLFHFTSPHPTSSHFIDQLMLVTAALPAATFKS